MDLEAAILKTRLTRFAALICFALTVGLMVGSLVAPARAQTLGNSVAGHANFSVGSSPRG